MTDINDAVTGVAPIVDYPAYSPYEPQQAWSEVPDYSDEPTTSQPPAPWVKQHWRATAVIIEVAAAVIGVVCWIVSLQHSMPTSEVSLPPPTQTTVIYEPAPLQPSTTQPPPAALPPPVMFPTEQPPPPSDPHWVSDPNTQLFTPAQDEQLAERLAAQNITATEDVINTAHDACIMIQDGDIPHEVDRTVAATSGMDLYRATLIVADAQLSYPNCYRNGDRHG